MNGDNKLSKDSIEELIYRASLKKSFQQEINSIRHRYSIPAKGFESITQSRKWYSSSFGKSWKAHDGFLGEIENLVRKEKIPITANTQLENYIITSNRFSFFSKIPDAYACDLEEVNPTDKGESELEKRWKRSGEAFVRVYIPRNAGLPVVKNYINSQWKFIKHGIFNKSKSYRSVKRLSNVTRDELILKYALEYKPTTGKKAYKQDIIAEKVTKDLGKKITGDAVKKVLARRKKRDS